MKTLKTSNLTHIIWSIFIIGGMFLISSCARKTTFLQSSVVPAAHGDVKVKKDDNQNYKIDVEVKDLAEVEKVYTKRHSYVVWMETDDGDTKKLGQLVSSRGFFSNQRTAELQTVSSIEPTRIFITAERDNDARYPNNKMILRTSNF